MSKTEEGTYTAKVGTTLQDLHAPRDTIGPQIGALIKEYVKG